MRKLRERVNGLAARTLGSESAELEARSLDDKLRRQDKHAECRHGDVGYFVELSAPEQENDDANVDMLEAIYKCLTERLLFRVSIFKSQLPKFLNRCLKNLEVNTHVNGVLRLMALLEEMPKENLTSKDSLYEKNASVRFQESAIEVLVRRGLISFVINTILLLRRNKTRQKPGGIQGTDLEKSYIACIQSRLDFIRYVISNCLFARLGIEQVSLMWNQLHVAALCRKESVAFVEFVKDLCASELNGGACFALGVIESLFESRLLQVVNPSESVFELQKCIMILLNKKKGILHFEKDFPAEQFYVASEANLQTEFVGLDMLWNVALHAENANVAQCAINFLRRLCEAQHRTGRYPRRITAQIHCPVQGKSVQCNGIRF